MRTIQIESFNRYTINEEGVVVNTETGKVLRTDLTSSGYRRVTLHQDGKVKRVTIHRLVAMHFVSNPEGKPMVNHLDGNKLNNHYLNLEWVTCKENTHHAFEEGLRNLDFQYRGPASNRSLTDEQVRLIRRLKKEGWKRLDIIALVGCTLNAYKNVFRHYKHVEG